jgi:hypothetical protein
MHVWPKHALHSYFELHNMQVLLFIESNEINRTVMHAGSPTATLSGACAHGLQVLLFIKSNKPAAPRPCTLYPMHDHPCTRLPWLP